MIKVKRFFLILLMAFYSLFVNAQNDDANNSSNSIKIWRASNDSDAVIAFPVNNFTVSSNTEKYIYVMVNYPAQPDIAISIDAIDKNTDGNFANIIRPIQPYTNFGKWETLVFPISGGSNGINVNTLLIYPDLGVENIPAGQILNAIDSFGYIDEIVLKDTNTLSTENIKVDDSFIYPNPSDKSFTISTLKKIKSITLFNNLGKNFTNSIYKKENNTFDISALSKGIYFVKIIDNNGAVEIQKLIKK